METNLEPYKKATQLKRSLAFVIDFLIVMILSSVISNSITTPLLFPLLGGEEANKATFSYVNDTGLFDNPADEKGEYNYSSLNLFFYEAEKGEKQDKYGYEMYLDKIYTYYTDFLVNDERATPIEGVSSYNIYFYEKVLKLPHAEENQVFEDPSSEYLSGSHKFFKYALDSEGHIDYNRLPLLKDEYDYSSLTSDQLKDLNNYFLNVDEATGIYYQTCLFAIGQDENPVQTYYKGLSDKMAFASWIAYLPASVPVILVFFYLIPVLSKKNKTIGKYITRTSVIDVNGLELNNLQRFLRPLWFTLLVGCSALPWSSIGYMILFIGIACDAFYLMKESSMSLHDRIFKTIVADDKGLNLFSTKEESDEYFKTHIRPTEVVEVVPREEIVSSSMTEEDGSSSFKR